MVNRPYEPPDPPESTNFSSQKNNQDRSPAPRRRAVQLPLKAQHPPAEQKRGSWQAPARKPAPETAGSSSTDDGVLPRPRPTKPASPAQDREAPASASTPKGTRARASARRGGFRVPLARRHPAIISSGEKTLFWTLLAAVLAMSIFLVRYREGVNEHFAERSAAVPLGSAGDNAPTSQLALYMANDNTGSLMERSIEYPLPADPDTRARIVLDKLLDEYAATGSAHPLKPLAPGVEGVDEVFLLPVPGEPQSRNQLAVVDLTPNFVHWHPSGIEPETLTLLSMIATLHANLPRVTQVRFLVDGVPQPTLAGHADMTQTYLAGAAQMTPREAFASMGVQP
jgi:hypothetical protein